MIYSTFHMDCIVNPILWRHNKDGEGFEVFEGFKILDSLDILNSLTFFYSSLLIHGKY